jgi:imidazolonepropionase-like amidohydrolase
MPSTFTIHTDCLFDSKRKKFVKDTSIVVDPNTGLITRVYQREHALSTVEEPDIDLRGKCVLPGLVDAHTHILLHAYSETPGLHQMRDESLVERIIRATNHCRTALLAGYTTYRDLGTESAQDADVHIRNAINRGIIPGPRIYCVTEPLASSGGYEIRHENKIGGVDVPRISDPCDGPVACRAAVRRRLGAGADVIKFYADYRKRQLRFPDRQWPGCPEIAFPPSERNLGGQRNPNILLFNQDEMDAIVAEAKVARAPVAAHASTPEAVMMVAKAGVTTVEHGFEPMKGTGAMQALKDSGTILVPTLAVVELFIDVKPVLAQVKEAFDFGVKFAAGGDTGPFAHGENAREIELMVEAGIPLEEVLTAATLHGWEACGGDWCGRKFGCVEEGFAADVIALGGDVRGDIKALRKVEFVMKDGRVWKRDGEAIGMI